MRSTPSEARGEGRASAERVCRRAARERAPESEKGSAWIHGVVQEALDKYFASLRPDAKDDDNDDDREETGVSR